MRLRSHLGRPGVLLLCAVLAGCGSKASDSGGATTTTGPTGPELVVKAKSFSYDPEAITVSVGTTEDVVLHSEDVTHDFTVAELGIHVSAAGGKTTRHPVTFDKPGTYTFFCSIAGHREAGMKGTLVIKP